MRGNSKPATAFIKLICIGGVIAALIWASGQFIAQATPAKLVPVLGVYIGCKIFCSTLDFIKLLAKTFMVLLIIYLLIF